MRPAALHNIPDIAIARLSIDEARARHIADVIAESLDPAETAVAAFEKSGRWIVEIHFVRSPDEAAIRGLVALAAGDEAAQALSFATLAARDWTKASLAGLTPVEAGRFVIHGGHDRARIGANRIGIEIEAALAFGTGHHGTTRGCLMALDRLANARRPRRVLDLGTGTGVLAIAAAKVLRKPVLASDNDVRAVMVAKENARSNRVASLVEVVHADGLEAWRVRARAPYDLILANILLRPLRRLAAPMARLVAPDGRIVLSGLLASQANAALAAYRTQGLALERRISLDGWATLVLVRRKRLR
jgi:ribosomal protein L11 methyltransferase